MEREKKPYSEINTDILIMYAQALTEHVETVLVLSNFGDYFKESFKKDESFQNYIKETKRINQDLLKYLNEFK